MIISQMQSTDIIDFIREDTGFETSRIRAAVGLLEEGATVPFIARYRKEATGELDEVQIRLIEERLAYHKELDERRRTILKTIAEQGKLTTELQERIVACRQKTELEDLYLPFKPKRRTKATIAKEQGLEPLAHQLLAARDAAIDMHRLATPFVSIELGVENEAAALQGAGHIIAELFADTAAARGLVRELTWEQGIFRSQPVRGKETAVSKFEMYYDFSEPLKVIPSHRMLAMRRGEKEEFLRLQLVAPDEQILGQLAQLLVPDRSPWREWLVEVIADAYQRLMAPSIEVELRLKAKQNADEEAIRVFADNLRNLLLAAPAGSRRVLGVDPGLRTGSKLAAVDETGRFLGHVTIYPHTGGGRAEQAATEMLQLIDNHRVEMVAIGNGTAGREMEQFVRATLKEVGKKLPVVMVSEAGASVYSASDIAREEFPDLDLTVRGAISIARRLQDPLAELVKVDPKSIGVGQYQHDVSQPALKKALDQVVESCVNYVGVDLNTASWALLGFVSGIGENLARGIVRYRDEQGAFASRRQLLKVPRFGQKAFEQAAGFLRIRSGSEALDNTAVHPERYPLVAIMARDAGIDVATLISRPDQIEQINLNAYVRDDVGLPTLRDIVAELKKPGRDPREIFIASSFREDVTGMDDLKEGMTLNGVVTNVAAFGAFVDIGVHQDGLVHVSQLADRFIKNPADVVRVGQQVQVRVLEVDIQRKRISLTMRGGELSTEKSFAMRPNKDVPGDKVQKKQKMVVSAGQTNLAAALEKSGFRVNRKK